MRPSHRPEARPRRLLLFASLVAGAVLPGIVVGLGSPGRVEDSGVSQVAEQTGVEARAQVLQQERPVRAIPPLRLPRLPRPGFRAPGGTTAGQEPPPPLLTLVLSEGVTLNGAALPRTPPAPLSDERVRALLARLPAREEAPQPSLPPPAIGPTAAATEPGLTAALDVLSMVPSGETELAASVTVVFSEPMVPLGMDGEALRGPSPVRLSPEPPGEWRWLDVRTLRFQPDSGRLPGATEYTVGVPADVSSLNGSVMASEVEGSFRTAGPRALGGYPNRNSGATDVQPTILITFDQPVDPAAVHQTVVLRTDGTDGVVYSTELVDLPALRQLEELGNPDAAMARAATIAGDAFWVALRPERALPLGSEVVLRLGEELPSMEGPLPAGRAQELRFTVRDSLEVVTTVCAEIVGDCSPWNPWWVSFTNPLDPDQDLAERVSVEPAVRDLRVRSTLDLLFVTGEFEPSTTYRVALDPDIRDSFGQRLGRRVELEVNFGLPPSYVAISGGPFQVLDPASELRIEVDARGVVEVEFELYRVDLSQWQAYQDHLSNPRYARDEQPWTPTSEPVASWSATTAGDGRGFSRVPANLSSAFEDGKGHAILVARGVPPDSDVYPGYEGLEWARDPLRSVAWIQSTSFALGATWNAEEVVGWAMSLADGLPLEGVEVSLLHAGVRGMTDEAGIIRLPLSETRDSLIVARKGDEVAILPASAAVRAAGLYGAPAPASIWTGDPAFLAPLWFSLTDRGLYRPGEELTGHGWVRELAGTPRRDLALPTRIDSVRYRVLSGLAQSVAEGTVPVTASGTFHLAVQLPREMRTGRSQLQLTAVSGSDTASLGTSSTYFNVEEFRRPEYAVTAEVDAGPHLEGETFEARVSAAYHDGAGLEGSPVSWRVRSTVARWAPPGWIGWRFGATDLGRIRRLAPVGDWQLSGETDTDGSHVVRIDAQPPTLPFPASVSFTAQVTDLNRQAGSARAQTLVHPAALTVAVRTDRNWIRIGEELTVDFAAVDLDGNADGEAQPTLRAVLEPDPSRQGGSDEDVPIPTACVSGEPERVAGEMVRPTRCTLTPVSSGTVRIEAEVLDSEGRRSMTEVQTLVLGLPLRLLAGGPAQRLELSPDRELYHPGDTARVLVSAPYYPVSGILTVSRHGFREVRHIRLDGPGSELRIPIHAEDAGGLTVRTEVAARVAGLPAQSARVNLTVEVEARRLEVEVTTERERVGPGDEVEIVVSVRNAEGLPAAGGEVALWVVDEAILLLGGYRLQDPLTPFYGLSRERSASVLPHRLVRWERRSLGPGMVSGEILDAATGVAPTLLSVELEGTDKEVRLNESGFLLRDVAPDTYHLVISRMNFGGGEVVVFERTITVPAEGLDLGTILVDGGTILPDGRQLERSIGNANFQLDAITVTPTGFTAERVRERNQLQSISPPAAEPQAPDPAEMRTIFRALAAFEPNVALDDDGRARVRIRLPDTMTRYRIMAVATHGATYFGAGEGSVTASRDLIVRATPPRVLHPGDRPEIPVIIQNASDREVEVEVVARIAGLTLEGAQGYRVRLAPGGRQEVRFAALATQIGDGELEIVAVGSNVGGDALGPGGSGSEISDAIRIGLPVSPAFAPRVVAVHERIDAGESVRLTLQTPPRAFPGYGAVELGLSTTLLQPLVDVLERLCLDPLPWPEPTVARVLGLSALDPLLENLRSPELPSVEVLRAGTGVAVDRLRRWVSPYRRRSFDGNWADSRNGFLTPISVVHAAHALQAAGQAGYDGAEVVARSLGDWVRDVWEAERTRLAGLERAASGWEYVTAAYALHVGVGLDSIAVDAGVGSWISSLELADLPVEAVAWLLRPASRLDGPDVIRTALITELENRALTTGATTTFRQGGRATVEDEALGIERLVLASSRRSDAAVLAALLEEEPEHPLIPGLVRGLLGGRDGSVATGPHESGWVLFALGRYAALHEASSTELRVEVALGGTVLVDRVRLGRDRTTITTSGPLPAPGDQADLYVATDPVVTGGEGTLYLRAAVRYSPVVTPELPADERGFLISRHYEAVDDSSDVQRDPDGTWRIAAGARVRVRLTFTAPSRRYQVQLRDPIPGGFEALNPRLRGTGFTSDAALPTRASIPAGQLSTVLASPAGAGRLDWTDLLFRWRSSFGAWATHEELRDDRMEAYTPFLLAGTYESTYLIRATTPGSFLAPPPRVEETEHPETFGQGRADLVVVEARR